MEGEDIDMSTSGDTKSPDVSATSTVKASEKVSSGAEDKTPASVPLPAYPVAAAIEAEYAKHRQANLARNKQLLEDLKIRSEVDALTAGFMKATPRRRGPNKPQEVPTDVRRSGRLAKERYAPLIDLLLPSRAHNASCF